MTLDILVSEHLEQRQEPETKRRLYYVNAVNGLREMAYDVTAAVANVQLEINDADVADLPIDFVNISRMALVNNDGIMISIASNPNISLHTRYNNCGVPQAPAIQLPQGTSTGSGYLGNIFIGGDYIFSSTYLAEHYRNGNNMGGYFGYGGGQYGSYRIDEKKRQIQFIARPVGCTSVIMEYLADINAIDGDFYVHPFQINALKMWVDWQVAIPKEKEGLTRAAELRYNTSFQVMRRRFNSEPAFDWINATRQANAASPRW